MKTVYENPWFRVIQDGRFHYIKETGADNGAVVLARQGGDFLFVRVRRPAHGDTFIEAPRGYGEPGESAAGCAARELCEETGYTVPPQALVALGRLRPNSAIFASSVQAFFAEIPMEAAPVATDGETEGLVRIAETDLHQALADGRLGDGFTLAVLALFWALRPGDRPGAG